MTRSRVYIDKMLRREEISARTSPYFLGKRRGSFYVHEIKNEELVEV